MEPGNVQETSPANLVAAAADVNLQRRLCSGGRPGIAVLFGSRVRPVMNLSIDDVRNYLAMRLERLNNKRLKVGDLKSDDGTITADIVTVDNSLVQSSRSTGAAAR